MHKPNMKPTLKGAAMALLCFTPIIFGAQQKAQGDDCGMEKTFKGIWDLKSEASYEQSTLTIDFYALNKIESADCDGKKVTATCYGVVFLDAPPGYVDDYCSISHASIKGDVAEIMFISSRDCGGYKATLTRDTETGQITVSNVTMTKAGWSKSPQSAMQNGMLFLPRKEAKQRSASTER